MEEVLQAIAGPFHDIGHKRTQNETFIFRCYWSKGTTKQMDIYSEREEGWAGNMQIYRTELLTLKSECVKNLHNLK